MSANGAKYAGKDFYKLLKVHPTASAREIKLSYYKMAQQLHPDKHGGCPGKEAQFKQVSEAYDVLRDVGRRREYDFTVGNRYCNRNNRRTAPPPPDYRRVYTSRPPPDWDTVWDHARHYEMHYGDGFQKLAVEQMRHGLEREGRLDYRSPLGRGFHFSSEPLHFGTEHNPFSKRPQGPPRVTYEYTEGSIHSGSGREKVTRRERIVEELHTRRRERQQRRSSSSSSSKNGARRGRSESPRRASSPFAQYSTHATASKHHPPWGGANSTSTRPAAASEEEQAGGCVIS